MNRLARFRTLVRIVVVTEPALTTSWSSMGSRAGRFINTVGAEREISFLVLQNYVLKTWRTVGVLVVGAKSGPSSRGFWCERYDFQLSTFNFQLSRTYQGGFNNSKGFAFIFFRNAALFIHSYSLLFLSKIIYFLS